MRWILALLLFLVGCGGDSDADSDREEAEAPSGVSAEAEAPTSPTEEDPEAPGEAEAPPVQSLQLVGVDRSALLFLNTSDEPWTVERVDAAPVVPLHAASFVGCGGRAAARTTRAVGVWERSGALVGQRPLPNLVRALGERLTAEIATYEESYDVIPGPEQVIDVGPLVQTDAGELAMNPTFSTEAFNGENEDCIAVAPNLQVPLPIDGVAPAPCERPTSETLSLGFATEEAPPSGFQCVYLSADDPLPTPQWLGRPAADVLSAIPMTPNLCSSEHPPEGPWERITRCTEAGYGGVTICKHEGDPRVFAALVAEEHLGCTAGPSLYVLRGRRVVANTGWGAELRVVAGMWIYGGQRAWYVDGPGREPLRFGRARPDYVFGSAR